MVALLKRLLRNTRCLAVAGLLLAAMLPACSSGTTASTVTVQQARSIISSASFRNQSSIRAVVGVEQDANAAEAARELLPTAQGDMRWAATFVYMSAGTDPSVLQPMLSDRDLTIRAMAAAGVVKAGGVSGIPVLITMLTQPSTLVGSDPPKSLWVFAAQVLAQATGQTFGPRYDATSSELTVAQQRWQAWFSANKSRLHFNAAQHLWSTS